jgi:hypothetical protein
MISTVRSKVLLNLVLLITNKERHMDHKELSDIIRGWIKESQNA